MRFLIFLVDRYLLALRSAGGIGPAVSVIGLLCLVNQFAKCALSYMSGKKAKAYESSTAHPAAIMAWQANLIDTRRLCVRPGICFYKQICMPHQRGKHRCF